MLRRSINPAQILENAKIPPSLDTAVEHRGMIANAFASGINDSRVAFIHGTSLLVLNQALRSGLLPGGIVTDAQGASHFYLLNLPSRHPITPKHCDLPTSDARALELARKYAGAIASMGDKIIALEHAQKPPSTNEIKHTISDPTLLTTDPRYLADRFVKAGVPRKTAEAIDDLFTGDRTPNKILLGFSRQLGEDFGIEEADGNDEGLRITVTGGIPLRYLTAVEPESDHAFNFLDAVQRSVDEDECISQLPENDMNSLRMPER